MAYTKKSVPIVFILLCVILFAIAAQAWDRFSNETEVTVVSGVSAEHIVRYHFSLSVASYVNFYTDQLTGNSDTYMHLWSRTQNREICRNDDYQAPSGNVFASRIYTALPPGDYTIYIRAYNQSKKGWCNLYRDGTLVLSNQKFAGYPLSLTTIQNTRLRTINVPSGKDTYILLLDENGEMIRWDDDGGDGLASSVIDGPEERQLPGGIPKLIVGAYEESKECICDIGITADQNFEFLSLCGPEQRHVEAGARFTEFMGSVSHNPSISTTQDAYSYMFQDQRLTCTDYGIDNVDLIWINSHGSPGNVSMRDRSSIPITGMFASCGSANRNNSMIGDLEYMAILTCKTVRIQHTQSFDWLETDGWKSNANFKGLFGGLHCIVGYHSTHSVTPDEESSKHDASTFACRLRDGKSIWQAWRETNEYVSDKFSGWFHSFSPGMASSICIDDQKDEGIAGHLSKDIVYGNSRYLFRIYWYGTGETPPN